MARHATNYYKHSNNDRSFAARSLLLATASLLGVACGASNNQVAARAPRVPIAHLSTLPNEERQSALSQLPLVLEVRKGDRFPVEAALQSSFVALHAEGPWTLEATETFYVLLREEGPPVISQDGVDFERRERQGSFSVGFDARAGEPAKLRVVLQLGAAPHADEPR